MKNLDIEPQPDYKPEQRRGVNSSRPLSEEQLRFARQNRTPSIQNKRTPSYSAFKEQPISLSTPSADVHEGEEVVDFKNKINDLEQRIDQIFVAFAVNAEHINKVDLKLDGTNQQLESLLKKSNTMDASVEALRHSIDIFTQSLVETQYVLSTLKTNISNRLTDFTNKDDEIRNFRYIARAADQMHKLVYRIEAHPEQQRYYVLEAATLACETLTEMDFDHDFRRIILDLSYTQKQYSQEYRNYTQDLAHFKQFLESMRRVLIRSHMSDDLIDQIIGDITQLSRELIVVVRSGRSTPEKVFDAVEKLRSQTCDLPRQLGKQSSKENRIEKLKKIAGGIAGATIVALCSSQQVIGTLTPAGAALGTTIGTVLIEKAAKTD